MSEKLSIFECSPSSIHTPLPASHAHHIFSKAILDLGVLLCRYSYICHFIQLIYAALHVLIYFIL
jgi:hypothetical protein